MKGIVALLAVVVVGFGALLGVAGASTKNVKNDPSGDSTDPGVDAIRATAAQKGKRLVVHTVTMDGDIPSDLTDNFITLQINLDGDNACEIEFRPPPFGKNRMIKCGVRVTSKTGKVTKQNARTIKYVFKRKLMGNPKKYGWRILVSEGCQTSCTAVDALPDDVGGEAKYVTQKLRG
jgi:hypothetical protein